VVSDAATTCILIKTKLTLSNFNKTHDYEDRIDKFYAQYCARTHIRAFGPNHGRASRLDSALRLLFGGLATIERVQEGKKIARSTSTSVTVREVRKQMTSKYFDWLSEILSAGISATVDRDVLCLGTLQESGHTQLLHMNLCCALHQANLREQQSNTRCATRVGLLQFPAF
jgi:hypothetical protein